MDVAHFSGVTRLGKVRPRVDHVSAQLHQLGIGAKRRNDKQVENVLCVAHWLPAGAVHLSGGFHQAVGKELPFWTDQMDCLGKLLSKENGWADMFVVEEVSKVNKTYLVVSRFLTRRGGSHQRSRQLPV